MRKAALLLLLTTITYNSFAQRFGAGLSMDVTGGYDFENDENYTVKYKWNSTYSNNVNFGAFVKFFIGKVSITANGNAGFHFLSDGMEYYSKNWEIDVNKGQYTTGKPFKDNFYHTIYGQYNPYYTEHFSREYTANVYSSSNNLGLSVNYQLAKWFTLGTGINVGFRRDVITIMEKWYHSQSAGGIYISDDGEVPTTSFEQNSINLSVPVILDFHLRNAMGVYISSNIGKDVTTTVGMRIDFAVMKWSMKNDRQFWIK